MPRLGWDNEPLGVKTRGVSMAAETLPERGIVAGLGGSISRAKRLEGSSHAVGIRLPAEQRLARKDVKDHPASIEVVPFHKDVCTRAPAVLPIGHEHAIQPS